MILSSLLILALAVASGILLSSTLLSLQPSRVSADNSDTNTDQKLGQGNTGSGDSRDKNIAANDVEVEESATLSVCKTLSIDEEASPEEFVFTVTGNNPSPAQFLGSADCVDVTIGPGEYAVSEIRLPETEGTRITGDCVQDPPTIITERATGEIQAGETQVCEFHNFSPN
jgi:hypothetical protein